MIAALDWVLRILGLGLLVGLAIITVDGLWAWRQPRCPDCGLRHGPAHRRAHRVGPDREQLP